ncbi:hypothetical protein SLEP1_g25640 [Rubroshorea leprosula]|uniref:Leucine-rich repeat-containing N-terminal plant-type domain-containing protein n=1 Tax=Rubroshorea leprosula TaxID=152421 RepID=A0AAV5JQ28_9ROSI|nr:hypothetical protein SLEP1_g25640 [Rubroshorea leprosula]
MGMLIWFSQILCLSFILLQFRVRSSSPSQSSLDSPPHLCHPEERSALLDFKSTTNMVEGCLGTPIIQTWNESIDCCLWEGITCDKPKDHVIGLDLSSNCLEADLTTNSSLFRLEKLQSLNLSHNNFSFPNISFGFHRWKSLTYLNLSTLGYMDGSLLFEISLVSKLVSLDLSCNYGLLLDNIKFQMLVHNSTELRFLILDSVNMFLVVPSSLLNLTSSLEYLSLSNYLRNNRLTGPIDHVKMPNLILQEVYLSNNEISGAIPSSFFHLVNLTIVHLSSNNLSGTITDYMLSKLVNLETLDLSNNSLLSLSNDDPTYYKDHFPFYQQLGILCKLETLDVGNNNLNDTFPHWLGVLRLLKVLILRSNQFHGAISNSMPVFYFPHLRIIDVAQNHFMGPLPSSYFKILKGMGNVAPADKVKLEYIVEERYIGYVLGRNNTHCVLVRSCTFDHTNINYKDFVKVVMKGLELKLERILTIFTTIDFSSNQFHEKIPEELRELNLFIVLNLSHNSLIGQIPTSLGKLAELESLDLSSNKLEGRIPEQSAKLTFLSILNLLHNELVGHIPEGKQFNTFSNDSYIGNSRLCGIPLTKKSHNEEEQGALPSQFDEEDDSTTLFEWKFALAGYGCGLVLGLSLGYIAFTIGKPWWGTAGAVDFLLWKIW